MPTLPSLGPKVWVGAGLGLGLREGRVGTSPETWIDPLSLGFWLGLVKLSSKGGGGGGLGLGLGLREGWMVTSPESWSACDSFTCWMLEPEQAG